MLYIDALVQPCATKVEARKQDLNVGSLKLNMKNTFFFVGQLYEDAPIKGHPGNLTILLS